MLKRIFAIIAMTLPFSGASAECINLGSATCTNATSYEITIEQVEFCKSSACTSPYVVASSSEDFDISSATAGGAVGNYADLDDVPAGIYTHVRTTIDGVVTYSAPATGSCSAQTNTSMNVTSITGISAALSNSLNDHFNLSVSGSDLVHIYELNAPLAISKAGALPQVQIDFSTADGHLCNGSTSLPGVPYVEIKVFNN
jgi:hypothetical protein